MQAHEKIIFALDFPSFEEAVPYVEKLKNEIGIFKIGLELFIKDGFKTVEYIKKNTQNEIFLDLKLLDIPKTVERSVAVIKDFGVKFLTVHAHNSSTLEHAVKSAGKDLGILGVTVLTSLDETGLSEQGIKDELALNPSRLVEKRTKLAFESGCSGVICSPIEAGSVKKIAGNNFFAVTPGIRMTHNEKGDQKRVSDPYNAVKNGSDYLVVGRPIRDSEDPVTASREIAEQIKKGMES